MPSALGYFFFSFVLTLGFIWALALIAPKVGLIDTPDYRKHHKGAIPVVGGIAILLTFITSTVISGEQTQSVLGASGATVWVFLLAATLLTILGALDDYRAIGVMTRTICEVLIALLLVEGLDLIPRNLGDLVGSGNIRVPDWAAYPFALIAIFGVINAYNMLDGIDGLLSSLILITVTAFHLFTQIEPSFVSLTLGGALAAFLVSNLELAPFVPKTFLGDAGSKLLGFIVVSLILVVTTKQISGEKYIAPVTALYLVALPLFDMVFITLRRIYGRKSPFSADRSHIHHLMNDLDMSQKRSVALISCAYLTPAFIGLMLDRAGAATPQQFFIFLGLFIGYCLIMSQAWRVAKRYQALKLQVQLQTD
ncbi:hypothetical protein R0137_17105 [Congregibacter brevis]|uniref:UDP-GlcNAc:undecaprenyl-phosphate GlcNAc-1-phosphate transferase n=1 Tax=Congregibacter brevis TaxID=3081201 RepID=A0ABZ0IE37_9GAMM|nr:hypothetical protein R0137_17105 [Congregibacter sp. IMCC45268]